MGGRAFSYQAPLLWNKLPVNVSKFHKQTPFPLVRLGFKLSFLIKLIVRGVSCDSETPHSCAAIGLDHWVTAHDTPFLI